METIDYWPLTTRIIEIGATDETVAHTLLDAGYSNYLAVVSNTKWASILRPRTNLEGRVAVAASSQVVSQNNAEVLILNGRFLFYLARFRSVRHSEFVAWRLRPTPVCVLALAVAVVQMLLGRFGWPRIIWWKMSELNRKPPREYPSWRGSPLVVWRVRRPRPHGGARRFIPHKLGVADFFRCLQQHDVQYAVLRWFELLPDVAAGEDLDVLVADRDLETVRSLLDSAPGIQAVDLYSVTGLPGADFQRMPYFPPHRAEELLSRTVVYRDHYRVPAPREHFLSLAYHALYHKGINSSLPRDANDMSPVGGCDHDYVTALSRLAVQAGFNTPIRLRELDGLLDSVGWRPPHDMLVRLSRRNRWVRELLSKAESIAGSDDGLAVFLVREEALRRGGIKRATRLLEQRAFQVLVTHVFEPEQVPGIARTIRGGNWGRGPWQMSGGPPVAAIVVYDPAPIAPSRRQRRRFPFLANARLLCKEQLRECFNEGLPAEQHCNVIHSSDNGREALDYLRVTMPHRVDEILTQVNTRFASRAAA
jgi:hypothetical protein